MLVNAVQYIIDEKNKRGARISQRNFVIYSGCVDRMFSETGQFRSPL